MTETTADIQQAPARPQFRFGGTYAVYLTPAGGLHISFRRGHVMNDDSGQIEQVPDAEDEHLPEIPAAFVNMLAKAMEDGKRPSPVEILRVLMANSNGDSSG